VAAAVNGSRMAELPVETAAARSSWAVASRNVLLVEAEKTIEMRL
jgi:hypothetical protein